MRLPYVSRFRSALGSAAVTAVFLTLTSIASSAQQSMDSFDAWCRAEYGAEWSGTRANDTGGPLCTAPHEGGFGLKHNIISEATLCPDGSLRMNESGSMYVCRDLPTADAGPQDFAAYCRDKHGPDWIATTNRTNGAPLCALQRGLSVVHRAVDGGDLCASGNPTFNEARTSFECSGGGTQTASNGGQPGKSGGSPGSGSNNNQPGGSNPGRNSGGGSGGLNPQSANNGQCGDNLPAPQLIENWQRMLDGHGQVATMFGYSDDEYWLHWKSIFEANKEALSDVQCVDREKNEAYMAAMLEPMWMGLANFSQLKTLQKAREQTGELGGPNLSTAPISAAPPLPGERAEPRYLASWAEVDQAVSEARQYRFYPMELALREYIIGTVTIDDQAIFDDRANSTFDFRQAELDVESLTRIRDENKERYEAALPGFRETLTGLDAEAERANTTLEAVINGQQVQRATDTVNRQSEAYLARIDRLEQRNATIAQRIDYLQNEDPASPEIRQARIDDLAGEAQGNNNQIAELEQAIFDLAKPVRTEAQQAAIDRATRDRNDALADISRRRTVALARLERDRQPYQDVQEKLDQAIERLAQARTEFEDARDRPRLPIAEIRTDHFIRTYVGFRPKLTKLDEMIAKAADLVRQLRDQHQLAREFMLDAGLGADLAGQSFARSAAASYIAQASVEMADALHSAAKDRSSYGPFGFLAKAIFYDIPSKLYFPPSYYDGREPSLAQIVARQEAEEEKKNVDEKHKDQPLWKEILGANAKEAEETVVVKSGKAALKTLAKGVFTSPLKYSQKKALEETLHQAMDSYLRNPDPNKIKGIQESLHDLNKKTKSFRDMVGKNGFKSMAKSFAKSWGKELGKSALKEIVKRQMAHFITDEKWANYMGAQLQLAQAVKLFRDTRPPLDAAEAELAKLRKERAELVAQFDSETGSLDERNDLFFPEDGYMFTIILAEDDPAKKARFRASVTLDGVPLEAVGSDNKANPQFAVPAGGGQYFENPDLPDELPLVITFEPAGTQPRVTQR